MESHLGEVAKLKLTKLRGGGGGGGGTRLKQTALLSLKVYPFTFMYLGHFRDMVLKSTKEKLQIPNIFS